MDASEEEEVPMEEEEGQVTMAAAPAPAPPLVSVIIPCYNAGRWLDECLESVAAQTYRPLELSLWDDCSSDDSLAIASRWKPRLEALQIAVKLGDGRSRGLEGPQGCGPSKNRAVEQSAGDFLCFLDADDIMMPSRVEVQLRLGFELGPEEYLVGSRVTRLPEDAQPRHTAWLNGMSDEQLYLQQYCESTLSMVTWFCARSIFDRLGGFSEVGRGDPEDLQFFYRHLDAGGKLARASEALVVYRSHEDQQSRGVPKEAIWDLRVSALQRTLLPKLPSFSIWSAGRDGKRFYRSLSQENRRKVVAFLDVDPGKLAAGQYYDKETKVHVPIVPWTSAGEARFQPTIICVKRGLHAGFEENLASLSLTEGQHFWYFL